MRRIVLKPGRERSVLNGHPWIFSGAIQGEGSSATEEVEVANAKGEIIGKGVYSPASMIRVRLLKGNAGELIRQATGRRTIAPNGGARLVNAENDGIPGFTADWYAGNIVCQFTSALAEYYRDEIVDALKKISGTKGISERLDNESRKKEGMSTEPKWRMVWGEAPPELTEIVENGIKFLVDVRTGHKTGFYLDQREARKAVGAMAQGRSVLNCFSYTGGFGIYAAKNGAKEVTQVDLSAGALELARKNAEINGVRCETVMADVFKYLRSCRDAGKKFGMIILDPPKFAESKGQLMKAARGYKDINLLAMKLLEEGGILATFSCSRAMTPEFFDKILMEAAADAKRGFQIVRRTGQADDHPVSLGFPEGLYLKGVILSEYQHL